MTPLLVQGASAERESSKSSGYRRKSSSFPKGEKGVDFEAAVMINALCKPWELGGHPHDFLVAHRSARITDSTLFYERDRSLIKRHERMVAEKEAWNKQREIREEMLQLLTRLHSIEKQRRHFIDIRQQNQDVTLDSPRIKFHEDGHTQGPRFVPDNDAHANTQILSATFIDNKVAKIPQHSSPARSCSRARLHCQSSIGGSLVPIDQKDCVPSQDIVSPAMVAEKKEVHELDSFDLRMESSRWKEPPLGSAASFKRNKRK